MSWQLNQDWLAHACWPCVFKLPIMSKHTHYFDDLLILKLVWKLVYYTQSCLLASEQVDCRNRAWLSPIVKLPHIGDSCKNRSKCIESCSHKCKNEINPKNWIIIQLPKAHTAVSVKKVMGNFSYHQSQVVHVLHTAHMVTGTWTSHLLQSPLLL